MSDYYQHEPTCPNCGAIQSEYVSTTDDPEIGDSYFICEHCKHKIRVHASMSFDYIDESLPECRGNALCGSRDEHNKCRAHFEYGKCASAVMPGEKTTEEETLDQSFEDRYWNCPKCGHDNDNGRLFCVMCEELEHGA